MTRTAKLTLLSLSFLSILPVVAEPLVPDAGQASRELQQPPAPNPPTGATPLRKTDETASRPPGEATTVGDIVIDVKAIRISGNNAVPTAELEAQVANLGAGKHTIAELEAGAARITAWYRAHGYVVARAYLPEQEIKDGVVLINVLEGLIDKRLLNNKSQLPDSLANSYLKSIRSGEAVQGPVIDRALLLLNDSPAVGGIRASLQPGASVGTTDLLIELDPAKTLAANIELDNYGNRYTGAYRMGSTLAFNSPLNIGDQLSVRILASSEKMTYARLAYQLPIGEDGMKIGGAYASTRYTLGKEFAALQAHGNASNTSLYASYPLIRSPLTNLSATLSWEGKNLADRTDVPASSAEKQVHLFNAGMAGNLRDLLLGGGTTSFDAALAGGRLSMDDASLATDASTAQSNGSFAKFSYSIGRMQRITDSDLLSLAFSGQYASKNLNSSEKFSLGGANGVRAFPQGEGSGDMGWMMNAEVRHNLLEGLQGVAFFDAGSVSINHTPYAGTANLRRVSGVGAGLNAQYGGVLLKAAIAFRTSGGPAQSEPPTANNTPRIWLQLAGQF